MFAFQDKRAAVEVAFTDRFGGVSAGPYAELNLSVLRDEEEDTVDENWDIVAEAMMRGGPPDGVGVDALTWGAPWLRRRVTMRQVHGGDVAVVDGEKPAGDPEVDGLVTATSGVILAARAADCIPVLLADPGRNLVGAAHAGRLGVVAEVVPHTVAALRALGAERLVAWIGPAACGRCYEVPATMREDVAAVVPATWSETSWGTPALDLLAGVRAQLRAAEVSELVELERCTIEDADFYSHRRQRGAAGRHAGLVWVRP